MLVPKYTYPAAASPMTPKTIRCVLGSLRFMVALPALGSVHQCRADRELHDAHALDVAFLCLYQCDVFEAARSLERYHQVGNDEVGEGDAIHGDSRAAGLVELRQPAVIRHVDREVVHHAHVQIAILVEGRNNAQALVDLFALRLELANLGQLRSQTRRLFLESDDLGLVILDLAVLQHPDAGHRAHVDDQAQRHPQHSTPGDCRKADLALRLTIVGRKQVYANHLLPLPSQREPKGHGENPADLLDIVAARLEHALGVTNRRDGAIDCELDAVLLRENVAEEGHARAAARQHRVIDAVGVARGLQERDRALDTHRDVGGRFGDDLAEAIRIVDARRTREQALRFVEGDTQLTLHRFHEHVAADTQVAREVRNVVLDDVDVGDVGADVDKAHDASRAGAFGGFHRVLNGERVDVDDDRVQPRVLHDPRVRGDHFLLGGDQQNLHLVRAHVLIEDLEVEAHVVDIE